MEKRSAQNSGGRLSTVPNSPARYFPTREPKKLSYLGKSSGSAENPFFCRCSSRSLLWVAFPLESVPSKTIIFPRIM